MEMENEDWTVVDDEILDFELQLQLEFSIWRENHPQAWGLGSPQEPSMSFPGRENSLQIGLGGLVWLVEAPDRYWPFSRAAGRWTRRSRSFAVHRVEPLELSSCIEDGDEEKSETACFGFHDDPFQHLEKFYVPEQLKEISSEAFMCAEAVESAETLSEVLNALYEFCTWYLNSWKRAAQISTAAEPFQEAESKQKTQKFVHGQDDETANLSEILLHAREAIVRCEIAADAVKEASQAGARILNDLLSQITMHRGGVVQSHREKIETCKASERGRMFEIGRSSDDEDNQQKGTSERGRMFEIGSSSDDEDNEQTDASERGRMFEIGSSADDEDDQQTERVWRCLGKQAVMEGSVLQWASLSMIEEVSLIECMLELGDFVDDFAAACIGISTHLPLKIKIVADSMDVRVSQDAADQHHQDHPPARQYHSIGLAFLLPHIVKQYLQCTTSHAPYDPNLFVGLLQHVAHYLSELQSICPVCGDPHHFPYKPTSRPRSCSQLLCQANLASWEASARLDHTQISYSHGSHWTR